MTPATSNDFSIVLHDYEDVVRDAAMSIFEQSSEVPRMLFGAPIRTHDTLYWEPRPLCVRNCAPLKLVTFVFEIFEPLEDEILIRYIMVRMPGGSEHEVERKADGSISKGERELSATFKYSDYNGEKPDQFGFYLEESEWNLPVGEYDMTIPIKLEEFPPGYNVWSITMCGCTKRANEDGERVMYPTLDCADPEKLVHCTSLADPEVILTFPIKGFHIEDTSPIRGEDLSLGVRAALLFVLALATERWGQ